MDEALYGSEDDDLELAQEEDLDSVDIGTSTEEEVESAVEAALAACEGASDLSACVDDLLGDDLELAQEDDLGSVDIGSSTEEEVESAVEAALEACEGASDLSACVDDLLGDDLELAQLTPAGK